MAARSSDVHWKDQFRAQPSPLALWLGRSVYEERGAVVGGSCPPVGGPISVVREQTLQLVRFFALCHVVSSLRRGVGARCSSWPGPLARLRATLVF